jgi:ABC-2 type transport system permease protein
VDIPPLRVFGSDSIECLANNLDQHLAAYALLEEFGRPLQVSKLVLDLSSFAHVPKIPGHDMTAAPFVWLTVVAAAFIAAGLIGLRRRDVL